MTTSQDDSSVIVPPVPLPIVGPLRSPPIQTASASVSAVPSLPALGALAELNLWCEGASVLCRCPACSAPVAVNVSLPRCACNLVLQLTADQQAEVHELAASLPPPVPVTVVAVPSVPVGVAVPVAKPVSAIPVAVPVAQVAASQVPVGQPIPIVRQRAVATAKPIGVRKQLEEIKRSGQVVLLLAAAVRNTPSWVVSGVLHGAAVIVLALLVVDSKWGQGGAGEKFALVASHSEALPSDAELEETPDVRVESPLDEVEEVAEPAPTQVAAAASVQPTELLPTLPTELPVAAPVSVVGAGAPQLPAQMAVSVPVAGLFAGRTTGQRAKLAQSAGGTPESENAVNLGLKWLASVQEREGHWSLDRWGGMTCDTGGAGLGVLPFLGAGVTHKEGEYQKTVQKALDWIVEHQDPDGDLRGNGGGDMYAHAICSIALCEAYAMTRDPALREPAQKSLDFIVAAQHRGGGWRYDPGQPGDLSVVGWQLMALRSGELAYLKVDPQVFYGVRRFLDSVRTKSTGSHYSYQPGDTTSHVMTAEGLLCRQYTGWPRNQTAMRDGIRWLLQHHPPNASEVNIYYWYYGTQVTHHYGGQEWRTWNNRTRELLINMQERKGAAKGSWRPVGEWGQQGGRVFMTSLALLTLEVYYRHLPLYQIPANMQQTDEDRAEELPGKEGIKPAEAAPAAEPEPATEPVAPAAD